MAVALGALILTGALFASGRVVFQFFPGIEGGRIYATVTMPTGSPLEHTQAAVAQLEGAADTLRAQLDEDPGGEVIRHVLSSIGKYVPRGGHPGRPGGSGGTHMAQVVMELAPSAERGIESREVKQRWRALTGTIPDAVELTYESRQMHAGDAIAIEFSSDDMDELTTVAAERRAELATFDAVFDISDSFRSGKQEVKLELLPEAKPLGITLSHLARQVRTAFYGVEVQRVQRGPDDVRVMVRYPEAERRSLGNLENMRIRAPDGTEIPLASVAKASLGRGFATISRTDGRRVVQVTADIDRGKLAPEDVMASLRQRALPEILARHPAVGYALQGEQRERFLAMAGLGKAFLLALLVIYALLAIPLKSYAQPLVIMAAIPFGMMGAILGHFIVNYDLMFFSLLGIVAVSGVVVNDSLVLVDYINRKRRDGMPLHEAVRTAGMTRFRPIFLTSATTFAGLLPLIFTASEATFFIIPIAISIAFGVVAATLITLFIVPCGYVILHDIQGIGRRERDPLESALAQPGG